MLVSVSQMTECAVTISHRNLLGWRCRDGLEKLVDEGIRRPDRKIPVKTWITGGSRQRIRKAG
jgi:hypothetical protein